MSSRIRSVALALALVSVLPAARLEAHDIGAMRVKAQVHADGTYDVDIIVDTEHLPPGTSPLQNLAERALGAAPLSPEEQARRIDMFRRRFLSAVVIAFDGRRVDFEEAPQPAAPPGDGKIPFHLKGRVPEGARELTWKHELPLGEYVFMAMN